jgi:hypothetical protein
MARSKLRVIARNRKLSIIVYDYSALKERPTLCLVSML